MKEKIKEEVVREPLAEDPPQGEVLILGPIESISIGITISLIVGMIVSLLMLENINNTPVTVWGSVIVGFLSAVMVFMKGINEPVKTANAGVVKFAGEQRMPVQLTEGWAWLPPYLFSHEDMKVVEITIVVGGDPTKPLEILAVKKAGEGVAVVETDEGLSLNVVELTGKVLIRMKVWNVGLALGFNYEDVVTNVVNYVNSTVRQSGSQNSYRHFIENRNTAADEIFEAFKRVPHEANNGELLTYSQQVEGMGYRVIDIELVKTDLPDSVKKATEMKAVEEGERAGEMVGVETLIMGAGKIKDAFPKAGDEFVINSMQAIQEDAKKQVFTGAASVIATSGDGGGI